jgi:hypothetical protein
MHRAGKKKKSDSKVLMAYLTMKSEFMLLKLNAFFKLGKQQVVFGKIESSAL